MSVRGSASLRAVPTGDGQTVTRSHPRGMALTAFACLILLAGCGGHAATRSSRSASSPTGPSTNSTTTTTASGGTTTSPTVPVTGVQLLYGWGRGSPPVPSAWRVPRTVNGAVGSLTGRAVASAIPGVVGRIVQITTSNTDGYALTASGAVWAWGEGLAGELGDGRRTPFSSSAVRVRFPSGVRIAALPDPVPYEGGMAIDTTGHVWAWGNNTARQFCRRRPRYPAAPIEVPLAHVTLAAGALFHTIYDAGGRVYTCGLGNLGQLGDGARNHRGRPTRVLGLPAGHVVALTSAWGNAGALMANGAYYDWGYNRAGQVGDGTTRLADVAVHVPLPSRVREVSQGGCLPNNGQTMALLANGSLWEWGNNRFGQLGNGSTHNALTPLRLTEPPGVHFTKINSGGAANYAIDTSGRLWSWGLDNVGQLGNGLHTREQLTPVRDNVILTQVSSTANEVAGFFNPQG
jgi:alpha-tubulin suppressor-like RCC1 family protein